MPASSFAPVCSALHPLDSRVVSRGTWGPWGQGRIWGWLSMITHVHTLSLQLFVWQHSVCLNIKTTVTAATKTNQHLCMEELQLQLFTWKMTHWTNFPCSFPHVKMMLEQTCCPSGATLHHVHQHSPGQIFSFSYRITESLMMEGRS